MKTWPPNPPQVQHGKTSANAFTIPELLLALAIFLTIMTGVVSLPILGLKMNALAASKLKSTSSSLKVLNQIRNQVLEAGSVMVGNGNSSLFTRTGTTGNALQVYSSSNTNNYLRFFLSTKTDALYEWNSANSNLWLLAQSITNQSIFETVDFQGNVSSSSQEHYSIRMTLRFAQLDYTIPTNTYEYYTLETQMTPRGQ